MKLYAGPPGSSTPENFVNLPVGGSGNNDSWYFDYIAGIVNFADTNVPTAAANVANVVYVEGARYTGTLGIANFGNITIGNISINGNTITGNTGISIAGNVTSAGYFYANGTNIVTAIQTYSNANVTSYLPTYSGNLSPGNLTTLTLSANTIHVDTFYSNTSSVITFALNTAIGLPAGGNIARPSSPQSGQIRFNSDLNALEFYSGTGWQSLNNTISGQDFSGDGVNNTYTLNNSSTTTGVLVSINGTVQQPGVAYSVTGNQITFAEVPQVTDVIDVRFLGTATTSIYDTVDINPTAILVTTANTIVDSFNTGVVRSVKYTISSTTAVDAHMAEVNLVQFNGTTVLNVTSNINTNGNTISYYANVNGSTVNFLANGTTTSNIRVQRTYFSV